MYHEPVQHAYALLGLPSIVTLPVCSNKSAKLPLILNTIGTFTSVGLKPLGSVSPAVE
nr:MAG TPA: hypothetical protein [Caudoviricetes sp.]